MKYKVTRPEYNDEFEFIIVRDKSTDTYKLLNLTSKTILVQSFLTNYEAVEFLERVNGWEVSIIKE